MTVLFGLILIAILAVLNAVPLTFFAMLFFGNVGWSVGFLDLIPGAMAVLLIKQNLITYNKGN
jgi:hypothetical protein